MKRSFLTILSPSLLIISGPPSIKALYTSHTSKDCDQRSVNYLHIAHFPPDRHPVTAIGRLAPAELLGDSSITSARTRAPGGPFGPFITIKSRCGRDGDLSRVNQENLSFYFTTHSLLPLLSPLTFSQHSTFSLSIPDFTNPFCTQSYMLYVYVRVSNSAFETNCGSEPLGIPKLLSWDFLFFVRHFPLLLLYKGAAYYCSRL